MKKFPDLIVENSTTIFLEFDWTGKKLLRGNVAARKVLAKDPLFSERVFSLKEHLEQVLLLKKPGGPVPIKTVKLGNVPYSFLYRLEGQRIIIEVLDITNARHDWLTGLPNMEYFNEMLANSLGRARRQGYKGGKIAVFSMDLNRFKRINDKYGHNTGDKLLVEVARRLQKTTRGGDIVARPGGDEFTAIAYGVFGKKDAQTFAERITAIFKKPIPVGRKEFHVGISIGIAIGPNVDGGVDPTLLFEQADRAMYEAKRYEEPWRFHEN